MEMVSITTCNATKTTDEECDICMYPMKYAAFSNLNCCKKSIHQSCLLKWAIATQSNELTCPFCRAHIVDIFEYIPLSHISQRLTNWKCDHNIVVRGKSIKIMIDANSADLVHWLHEPEVESQALPADVPAQQQTLPVQSASTVTSNKSDNVLFWCFFCSIIAIIVIIVIIIAVTGSL